jgi:hypothetical protein
VKKKMMTMTATRWEPDSAEPTPHRSSPAANPNITSVACVYFTANLLRNLYGHPESLSSNNRRETTAL